MPPFSTLFIRNKEKSFFPVNQDIREARGLFIVRTTSRKGVKTGVRLVLITAWACVLVRYMGII